ncbi:MAG: hypothetical protein GTO46_00500 [Gemmatimonadetes bacterium]|nr:hypothetical protein [Gemmatimonadota bacterium]NIO30263.1 hypothetical protein [Gemmatimonadota bacterium]
MLTSRFFRKYLLPGFVFQSVVIAGGYGTGRELVEFFLTFGPVGGLLAMLLVSTVIWSAVCAASYEFARVFQAYDYRSFFTHLLGRGWFLYEVCYFALLAIILGVIAAAAGSILEETFALPYAAGVLGIMAAVGFLVFRGSTTIAKVLATWSFVLYAVYITLFVWSVVEFGPEIRAALGAGAAEPGWIVGGIRYAAYNLAIIPAVFFALRDVETRREAVTAGLLTGPIGIIPALLFFIAMSAHYPAILDRPVPANLVLEALGSRTLQLTYQIVLFGTLIETGTGLIHAVNERIAGVYSERGREMPRVLRPVTATALLVAGAGLASFGLIGLIARGYGTLTWCFLIVFVIPILSWGIYLIRAKSQESRS